MTTLTVFLPEMIAFPLRIGANPALLDALRQEPLIFAAHYATVGSLFDWPDDIREIVDSVRERYAKHDELLELMERLRPQVGSISLSPERARQLAEGLDVFTRLHDRLDEYRRMCAAYLDKLKAANLLAGEDPPPTTRYLSASQRVAKVCQLLSFSSAERALFNFAIAYTVLPDLQLLTNRFMPLRLHRQACWLTGLGVAAQDLKQALSPRGRLIGSGILKPQNGIPVVPDYWVDLLLKLETLIEAEISVPLAPRESTLGPARLPAEDRDIIRALLRTAASGTHPPVRQARRRQAQSRLPPDQRSGLPGAHAGAGHPGRGHGHRGPACPLDERILAETPLPTLWLASDASSLHRDTLAHFLFHAEALKGCPGRARRNSPSTLPLNSASPSS